MFHMLCSVYAFLYVCHTRQLGEPARMYVPTYGAILRSWPTEEYQSVGNLQAREQQVMLSS